MDTDPQPRTRGPRTGARCSRDGCPRVVSPKRTHSTCSLACGAVVDELANAQRVCAATGDGEHWAAAVALSDALTALRVSDRRVYRAARDIGLTDEQWRAIKHG
jgi:hypothetical protein